ncbi:MAG: tetratricopeptide repeat protein, partial [Comamonadaceae bacterium]|nr:tetratricopeptide repeat protein [Comamonadaceae bacterium]
MAGKLYDAIIEAKAVPWAKLGVARAQADSGRLEAARRTLEALVTADPQYADAWDVMGRVQIDQGKFEDARDLAQGCQRHAGLDPAAAETGHAGLLPRADGRGRQGTGPRSADRHQLEDVRPAIAGRAGSRPLPGQGRQGPAALPREPGLPGRARRGQRTPGALQPGRRRAAGAAAGAQGRGRPGDRGGAGGRAHRPGARRRGRLQPAEPAGRTGRERAAAGR